MYNPCSPLTGPDAVCSPLSVNSDHDQMVAPCSSSPWSTLADDSLFLYSAPEQLQLPGAPTPSPSTVSTDEDLKLVTATLKAEATGSTLPLIKEDLRYKIQRKRRESGLGELKVEIKQRGPEVLTSLDQERRCRRRASNRKAATKCREKKKKAAEELAMKYDNIQKENEMLKQEVEELKARQEILTGTLLAHEQFCQLKVTQQPNLQPSTFSAQSGVDANMMNTVEDSEQPAQVSLLQQLEDGNFPITDLDVEAVLLLNN